VVAKWEGGLDEREPADRDPPHAPTGHGPKVNVDSYEKIKPGQA
jgi:hypothetical protein